MKLQQYIYNPRMTYFERYRMCIEKRRPERVLYMLESVEYGLFTNVKT